MSGSVGARQSYTLCNIRRQNGAKSPQEGVARGLAPKSTYMSTHMFSRIAAPYRTVGVGRRDLAAPLRVQTTTVASEVAKTKAKLPRQLTPQETIEESLALIDWPDVCAQVSTHHRKSTCVNVTSRPKRVATNSLVPGVQVAAFAATSLGHRSAKTLTIGSTFEESMTLLEQTRAAQNCTLTFDGVYDITQYIEAAAKGTSTE
eukprot:965923-Pyramimonas_sp.AAC.1